MMRSETLDGLLDSRQAHHGSLLVSGSSRHLIKRPVPPNDPRRVGPRALSPKAHSQISLFNHHQSPQRTQRTNYVRIRLLPMLAPSAKVRYLLPSNRQLYPKSPRPLHAQSVLLHFQLRQKLLTFLPTGKPKQRSHSSTIHHQPRRRWSRHRTWLVPRPTILEMPYRDPKK